MTTDDAIVLIKAEVNLPESPELNQRAQAALKAAFSAVNRLGTFSWNTREVLATLTAGQARYYMNDLWPGVAVNKIAAEIFFTDSQRPVDIVERGEFSKCARINNSATGRPMVGMAIGADKVIEFYPAPDQAYQIYTLIRFNITQMEEVNEHLEDLVISRALIQVLSANDQALAYTTHLNNWTEGKKEIIEGGELTFWKGTQIQGMAHGLSDGSHYRGSADSRNLYGD